MQSKPVLILLALVVVLFVWKVIGLSGKLEETYKDKKIEEQKISDLENQETKLTNNINKLSTDEGKEEVIRNNYGLVKSGENVIVIVDDKNQVATPPQPESNGFFSWFKNLFK